MCAKQVKKVQGEVPTTGHEWDGIREFDNPMPRWWVWMFYATIAFAVWYVLAYPAWPLLNSATQGYLGYDTRQEVEAEIKRFDDANAAINWIMPKKRASTLTALRSSATSSPSGFNAIAILVQILSSSTFRVPEQSLRLLVLFSGISPLDLA